MLLVLELLMLEVDDRLLVELEDTSEDELLEGELLLVDKKDEVEEVELTLLELDVELLLKLLVLDAEDVDDRLLAELVLLLLEVDDELLELIEDVELVLLMLEVDDRLLVDDELTELE